MKYVKCSTGVGRREILTKNWHVNRHVDRVPDHVHVDRAEIAPHRVVDKSNDPWGERYQGTTTGRPDGYNV